jgi:hypothetical protein
MSFIYNILSTFTPNKKLFFGVIAIAIFLGGASTITYDLSSSSLPPKHTSTHHVSTKLAFHPSTTTPPSTKQTVPSSVPPSTTTTPSTTYATATTRPAVASSRTSSPKTPTAPVTAPPVTAPPVTVPPVTVPPVTVPPITSPPITSPPPVPSITGIAWYSIQSCPASCSVSVIYTLSNGTLSSVNPEIWTYFLVGSITVTVSPASGFSLPYPVTLTYNDNNTTTWTYPSGDPPPQP